ncbi:hypothetical protein DC522_28365 [Microvirga sp. KLBC 81]|nr:hypothetical protein DC522_28365 [Microvirga sp. KLBC 81]
MGGCRAIAESVYGMSAVKDFEKREMYPFLRWSPDGRSRNQTFSEALPIARKMVRILGWHLDCPRGRAMSVERRCEHLLLVEHKDGKELGRRNKQCLTRTGFEEDQFGDLIDLNLADFWNSSELKIHG